MGRPSWASTTAYSAISEGRQRSSLPLSLAFGQHLDLALTLADENAKAGADPAFDAHLMPIGDWPTAVWESLMLERAMERLAAKAKQKLNGGQEHLGQSQRPCSRHGSILPEVGMDGHQQYGAADRPRRHP